MRTLTFTIIALLLMGCGGSGSGGTKPRNLSAFIGTWEGTYQERMGARRKGTVRITLERPSTTGDYANGGGTVTDSARGTGDTSAYLYEDGDLNITFGFGGDPVAQYPYIGTPRIDARGHLVAPLLYGTANGDATNDFDLAPVALGSLSNTGTTKRMLKTTL